MLTEHPDAVNLVDLLKRSRMLDQNSTSVEFSDDGTTCCINLVWKSGRRKCLSAKGVSTKAVLCNMLTWTSCGTI